MSLLFGFLTGLILEPISLLKQYATLDFIQAQEKD